MIFNERKLIYRKSENSIDSLYSDNEMNDSFQLMRNDQSVRESLRDENFDQENRNVKEKVTLSAESLQSVRNSQKTTYQVDNQIASTHAIETEINPADENAKHFVLVSELETKMIN